MNLFGKFKKFGFAFVVFLFEILNVNAAYNPYDSNGPYGVNCTWYTWQKAYEIGGVALTPFGNANEWYNDARNAGYSVGSTPQANSVIVWGEWTEYGHVGYVESVSGDTMYIWDSSRTCSIENDEYNACIKADADIGLLHEGTYQKCDPLKTSVPCEYKVNEIYTTGYIYLNEPKQTPQFNNNANYNGDVDGKKSSNSYLSELKISDLEVNFDKENFEYVLEVENDIDEITISAKAEDEKSKIDGIGNFPLDVGKNNFVIKVTAEDSSEKTYTIKIKRKDNNAYLTKLVISNIDIDFDKDTLEYEFQVARDIGSITIEGKPESKLANIEGLGKYELLEEETTITVTVIAEDETTKNYTITIKKEPITKETIPNKKINIWIVVGISIAIIGIITFLIILIIKKKKKQK